MEFSQNINWFPGHMAKARREIKENLRLVDLSAELIDARIPVSSRNSEFSEMCKNKPRIIILNKSDLVSSNFTDQWLDVLKKEGTLCLPYNSKSTASRVAFIKNVKEILKEKLEAWKSRGMTGKKIRIMVLGIPNVGKSTFINSLLKRSKAKVENKPGVTRKNQWFSMDSEIELLDTPGVLLPKIENKLTAYNLAITGTIKKSLVDVEDLAYYFIETIKDKRFIIERYKLNTIDLQNSPYEILNLIGLRRGILSSGGEVNTLQTAEMILDEFRSGKLGNFGLEYPEI